MAEFPCEPPANVSSMEIDSNNQNLIVKDRLQNAVQLNKKSFKYIFAWGDHVKGIDTLVPSLKVKGCGEIPVPVSIQVFILLIVFCFCVLSRIYCLDKNNYKNLMFAECSKAKRNSCSCSLL